MKNNDYQEGVIAFFKGNYKTALTKLRPLAEKGNVEAMYYLGSMYEKGKGVGKNYKKAFKWHQRAANKRYYASQAMLAMCYWHGQGVAEDNIQAYKWLYIAKESGCEYVQEALNIIRKDMTRTEENKASDLATKWIESKNHAETKRLKSLAKKGNSSAQNDLGVMYGRNYDYEEAVKWIRLAADQGLDVAQENLGRYYYHGQGVKTNKKSSFKWFRMAAEKGNVSAQNILGYAYNLGAIGVKKNIREAIKWYQIAANGKNDSAQCSLGELYLNGYGVRQNFYEAVKWFKLAAKEENAKAQYWLGCCYEDGVGTKKNIKTSNKWFSLAAKQEANESNLLYISGKSEYFSKRKNKKNHLKWLRFSAQKGNKDAQWYLGWHVIEKDFKEGMSWLRKGAWSRDMWDIEMEYCCHRWAEEDEGKFDENGGCVADSIIHLAYDQILAEMGFTEAQCELGVRYLDGITVRKNRATAIKWFKEAIERDYLVGKLLLGKCYLNGLGVKKNIKKAINLIDSAFNEPVGWWSHLTSEPFSQIALCYKEGTGVKKNSNQARKWEARAKKFEKELLYIRKLGD